MNEITVYKPTLPINWEKRVPIALQSEVKNFDTPQIRAIDPDDVRKTVAGGIVRLSSLYRKEVQDEEIMTMSMEITSQLRQCYPAIRQGEILNVIDAGVRGEFGELHDLASITPALILGWVRAYYKGELREKVRKGYLDGKRVIESSVNEFEGKSPEEYGRHRVAELKSDYSAGKPIVDHRLYAINYLVGTGQIELTEERKIEIREQARKVLRERYTQDMVGGGMMVSMMARKRIEGLKDDDYTPLKLECSAIVLREYFDGK